MRTRLREVALKGWQDQAPTEGHWGGPMQERWGLRPHQKIPPGLADKLGFTVTATGSYQEATALAAKRGCPVDDSTLSALARRVGAQAEAQTQARWLTLPTEIEPRRKPRSLAVLLRDGWLARFRGPGWGARKTVRARVEWHEIETGVFDLHEQAAQRPSGRGGSTDQVVIHWQGEPLVLGRRLNWATLRRGWARAQATLVLGDGSAW